MASSDNLSAVEPWTFRQSFADSWISEAFGRDTETLTRALHKSLCSSDVDSLLDLVKPEAAPTPSASNVTGSDPETAPKRQRNAIPGASGKVSKRKSRASKRSQTTFITADPANFRQMVQQVTGVRLGNAQMAIGPVLKPEPQRPGGRMSGGAGCLPTLDTSAFLLDHHQQNLVMGPGSSVGGPLGFQSSMVAEGAAAAAAAAAAAGLDFETFPTFPTLESWKVM